MEIEQIRKQIRLLRNQLNHTERMFASQKITNTILQMEMFKSSNSIACYFATNTEVNTDKIIETCWQTKQKCFMPVLENSSLQFARYLPQTELTKNCYNIPEPKNTKELISPPELDLVIVPLLAFDANCNRIGQGAGFYDRTFAFKKNEKLQPYLVGIAYELQKIEKMTAKPWDIPLNYVITENKIYQRS